MSRFKEIKENLDKIRREIVEQHEVAWDAYFTFCEDLVDKAEGVKGSFFNEDYDSAVYHLGTIEEELIPKIKKGLKDAMQGKIRKKSY